MTAVTTNPTAAALEAHGRALIALVGDLRSAVAVQWDEPPRKPVDPTPGRSGRIADPTPRIALNERRLKVRAAILGAESALAIAADQFESASAALEEAVREWWNE